MVSFNTNKTVRIEWIPSEDMVRIWDNVKEVDYSSVEKRVLSFIDPKTGNLVLITGNFMIRGEKVA